MAKSKAQIDRPCRVCGAQCAIHQRNTDGSYACDGCLHSTAVYPVQPAEKAAA